MTCPICRSSCCKDLGIFTRCLKCGVVKTVHKYDSTLYGHAYSDNYIQYANSPINTSLNLFRLGLVSRWMRDGHTILDIGCCIGEFLRFAQNYYLCEGFEPNLVAAAEAQRRIPCAIHTSLSTARPVEMITMFDVLEHIEDPQSFLTMLSKDHLTDNGIIALTTPNVEFISSFATVEEYEAWKHFKPKEHLFLYTPESLETLFQSVGFECIHWGHEESDIRPGNPNMDIMTCVARKKTDVPS